MTMMIHLFVGFLLLSTGLVKGYHHVSFVPTRISICSAPPSPSPFWPVLQASASDSTDATTSGSSSSLAIEYTGLQRDLDWKPYSKPVPISSELALLKSGVLHRRGEFGMLKERRYEEMRRSCERLGMTMAQGLLIRKQVLITKVVRSNWKLEKKLQSLRRRFGNQQRTLLELSHELNLPPVSILRAILQDRVTKTYPRMLSSDRKRLVKSIIYESADSAQMHKFLTEWELGQLQIAKQFDVVGYQNEPSEIKSSIWEEALYAYLDEQEINYIREEEMREADMQVTPDCLLLDDFTINGKPVRWIDSKSFYGSGLRESRHMAKSLKRQVAKYETEYGERGAVIYRHGFSQKLETSLSSTLFLDAGPLLHYMD